MPTIQHTLVPLNSQMTQVECSYCHISRFTGQNQNWKIEEGSVLENGSEFIIRPTNVWATQTWPISIMNVSQKM